MHGRLLQVLLLIPLAFGCAAVEELLNRPTIMTEPTIAFERMRFRSLSLFYSQPVFYFKITNPNPMGIQVESVQYNLRVNQRKFIRGAAEKTLYLPATDSGTVALPVTLNHLDFFQTIEDFARSDRVSYALSGSISVGPFDIPYQREGEFDLPRLPRISLRQARVESLSLTGAALRFDLALNNPNRFPLRISGLEYGVGLEDKSVASGRIASVPAIAPQTDRVLSLPVNLDFLSLGRSIQTLFRGESAQYRLSGRLGIEAPGVGTQWLPFEKQGSIQLDR